MSELISSIVATRNRRRFFEQALRCFLRQTYRRRELIVVDDGDKPVGSLCDGLDGVRYVRLERPTPMGAKLNLGIERAAGSILHKWDDDDYYHPAFLETAVAHLPARNRGRTLVAWNDFLIYIAGEPRLRYSGGSFPAGGTFCFGRELWERGHFRELPRAVDAWLLSDHRPRLIHPAAPELYVLVRHRRNTWTLMPDRVRPVDDYLGEFPIYPKPMEAVLGGADCRFYRSLARTRRSRPAGAA